MRKDYIESLLSGVSIIPSVLSVNLVGSYFEKQLEDISDIDFVIVVNKLDREIYDYILNYFKKFDHKKFLGNYEIQINSSFGPLKIYDDKLIILHIMIYDIDGHVEHVINSPFTCFDWERTENFKLNKLNKLFPVGRLMLNDFLNARRGVVDYKNDIKKNQLSIREYSFENQSNYAVSKKYIELDSIHLTEYTYHIVKNLLNNYVKFLLNINELEKIDDENYSKHLGLTYTKYKEKIYEIKNRKDTRSPSTQNDVTWVSEFLDEFYRKTEFIYQDSTKLIFIRHAKTKSNNLPIFFGTKNNSEIINKDKVKSKYEKYTCYTSPSIRAKQTVSKYGFDNFTESELLSEIDYGKADGMLFDEFKENYSEIIRKWSEKEDPRFPEGENNYDVSLRVEKFLNSTKFSDSFIVTHQVFLRCLFGKLFNIPIHLWYLINIPHNTPLEVIKINHTYYPNISRNMYKVMFKNFIHQE